MEQSKTEQKPIVNQKLTEDQSPIKVVQEEEEAQVKEPEPLTEEQLKLQEEMSVIKGKLYDFVEEIVQRQNKNEEILTFQSFQAETTSRKVLQELLQFFNERDAKNENIIAQVKQTVDSTILKIDTFDKEHKQDTFSDTYEKKVDSLKEQVTLNKSSFESRFDVITIFDQRFQKLDKENTKLRELIHNNRDRQANEINDVGQKIGNLDMILLQTKQELSSRIEQNKYWIQKYNESIVNLDIQFGIIKSSIQAGFEKLESENERRLITEDFKRGMRHMNEYLTMKFRDQDDMKNSLRDTIAYLKLYVPSSIQMQINESFTRLLTKCSTNNSASNIFDLHGFFQFQHQKLDDCQSNIKLEKSRADKQSEGQATNIELNEQLVQYAIQREELNTNGPIKKTVEDFIRDLIKAHIEDQRIRAQTKKSFTGRQKTAEQIRKVINLNEIQEIIDKVDSKTEMQLKKSQSQVDESQKLKRKQEQQNQLRNMVMKKPEPTPVVTRADQDKKIKTQRSCIDKDEDFFMMRGLNNSSEIKKKFTGDLNMLLKTQKSIRKANKGNDQNMPTKLKYRPQSAKGSQPSIVIDTKVPQTQKNSIGQALGGGAASPLRLQKRASPIIFQSSTNNNMDLVQEQDYMNIQAIGQTQDQSLEQQMRGGGQSQMNNNLNFMQQQQLQLQQMQMQMQMQMQVSPQFQIQQQEMVHAQTQQQSGNLNLSAAQRKKLVQELKEDILQITSNAIELKVQQEITSVKNQVRKLELDIATSKEVTTEKFLKEISTAVDRFREEFSEIKSNLTEDIKNMHKQRVRDKSDIDIRLNKIVETLKEMKIILFGQQSSVDAIAQIQSIISENLNMQIYCDEQDQADRNKVSLLGGKEQRLTKVDLHGSTHERNSSVLTNKALMKDQSDQSFHDGGNDQTQANSMSIQQNQNFQSPRSMSEEISQSEINKSQFLNSQMLAKDTKGMFTRIVKLDNPIKVDQTCLSCQHSGHDTQQVLYMFKVACLSYAQSKVQYRDKMISRQEMIKLRKLLLDKCSNVMSKTPVFKANAIYPKRYFDDLIIEDSLMNQSSFLGSLSQNLSINMQEDIVEGYQKKMPFGIGQKQGYDRAIATISHKNQTVIEQDSLGISRNKDADSVPRLGSNILQAKYDKPKLDQSYFVERNRSLQIAETILPDYQKQNSSFISTSRNNRNNTIDYKTLQSTTPQGQNTQRQLRISRESSTNNPNFDIKEIIKNPNAQIKKYSKVYHDKLRNQNLNLTPIVSSGIIYPSLTSQVEHLSKHLVSTRKGFQDLPLIKKL